MLMYMYAFMYVYENDWKRIKDSTDYQISPLEDVQNMPVSMYQN